ncbi:MAG: HAMP domain-containing histidine kinase [Calditrichaceae bacterium]|nr:HAMP domain-containing histidine kinase [Calditrichaceae bacterium]HES59319.1 HAMP domain-containing histidine kinase [Caldithrix sp.]
MAKQSDIVKEVKLLKNENRILLTELEEAYKNMEMILVQTEREKEITYRELEQKYRTLQKIYTELSRKENMLIHMEKLSSIGQFIAEIVHELKNPLTVIGAAADIALLEDLPNETKNVLNKIPEQVNRMQALLGRFKAMAYKEKEKFEPIDINTTLKNFIETIELIAPKSIDIIFELSNEKMIVKGDLYQLVQIYLNLAKNAFDLLDEKIDAKLTISTKLLSRAKAKKNQSKFYCQKPDTWKNILRAHENFALIEFADNGPGIPEEHMHFLFDTFFTTKERSKGTGLGLAISQDIAIKHNANIIFNSEPNQGTTVQIYVPIIKNDLDKKS